MESQDKRPSVLISNQPFPSTQLWNDDANNSFNDNNKQPQQKRKSASTFDTSPISTQSRKRPRIKAPVDRSRNKEKKADNNTQSQHHKKSISTFNQSSNSAQSQTHSHLEAPDTSLQDQVDSKDNNVDHDISEHDSSNIEEKNSPFDKHQSLLQQAEQFRFGTLNLQLNCVDPIWDRAYGTNRPIKPGHINHLLKEFELNGIHRMEPQNHLYVACSAETWAQLQKHCEDPDTWLSNPDNPTQSRSIFTSIHNRKQSIDKLFSPNGFTTDSPIIWGWKNKDSCRLELLAGQHRIRALRRLLEKIIGDDQSQIAAQYWWTCAIYNQGNVSSLRSFY